MEQDTAEALGRQSGPGMVVTPRDRHLLAFLAQARLLTTKQIGDLAFPGRHITAVGRRLRALAARGPEREPCVRQLTHRILDGGFIAAWALAEAGFVLAERLLGPVSRPALDVKPEFREHLGLLNELFVRLVLAVSEQRDRGDRRVRANSRAFAKATGLPFRWNGSETSRLPWQEFDMKNGLRQRVILPDAIVELPGQRRRIFVECEMGTHSIVSADESKTGATLAKVRRYDEFIHGTGDARAAKTFYAAAFPDGFAPELLFLVLTEGRGRAIERAIGKLGTDRMRGPAVRAHTLEEAVRVILASSEGVLVTPPETGAFTFSGEELESFRSAFGELNTFVEEARHALGTVGGATLPTRALRRIASLLARAAEGRHAQARSSTRAEGSP